MSGLPVLGSTDEWSAGLVGPASFCVLAPNPSPMTLDGTNTWLIGNPREAAVVVDPGPADQGHLAAVIDAAEERDLTINQILLTHGHEDHSAGALMFAERFGVSVVALDPAHRLGSEGLAGGQSVAVGDLDLHVVATPGHSSDSLSFVLSDGSCLTGDTVLGRGTTVVAFPDGSLQEYLDSLIRLQRLAEDAEVTSLLPGHGPTVDDPGLLLQQYWDHRQERLKQVADAIAGGADNPMAVIEMVYQPIPDAVIPAALASVQAQWDYLQQ